MNSKSELILNQFLNMSYNLFCIVDMHSGQFKYTNPAWKTILGYSKSDLLGKPYHQFLFPKDREKSADEVKKLLADQITIEFENRYIHKKGSIKTILWTANPSVSEGLIYCVGLDITSRKNAEIALHSAHKDMKKRVWEKTAALESANKKLKNEINQRKQTARQLSASEERLRSILKTAIDGFVMMDSYGKICEANEAYCEMVGYNEAELLTMHISDLEACENDQEVSDHMQRIILKGADRFETQHRRKDGTILDVEVIIQYRSDEGGQFVSFIRDITDRKKVENDLQQSEEKFRQLFDNSPIGKSMTYFSGEMFSNNAFREMLGYSQDEFRKLKWQDVTHPEDIALSQNNIDSVLSGEKDSARFTKRYIHKNGAILWADVSTKLRRDHKGNPLYYITAINNITDRKQAEFESEITIQMLEIINSKADLHDLMKSLLLFIQNLSSCEAVGIRLRDGDDFPYYETRGFSDDFVMAENQLCVNDLHGQLMRDDFGNPILECMCGNIICGRFNPSLPFFTEFGSFVSNGTSELLASTTEEDRQARTRNRCNGEGYESVMLVPLRSGGETFGLLQFNDRAKNRFSPYFVSQVERLAANVAIAVAKLKTDEALRSERAQLISLFDSIDEIVYVSDPETYEILYVNKNIQIAFGKELIGGICYREFQGFESPCEFCTNEIIKKKKPAPHKWEYHNPKVNRDFAIVDRIIQWPDGRDVRFELAVDITERNRAEESLRRSEEKYRELTEFLPIAIFEIDNDGNVTFANRAALDSTGYTLKDIRDGLHMLQVIAPKDRERAINMSQQVMQGGLTGGAEYLIRSKDGRTYPGFINTRPSKSATQGLMGYIFDLTTQKKAENELREKEDELQKILDTIQAGIIIIDEQTHKIVDVNPAAVAVIGIPKEKIIDKICHNYICPADKGFCPITDLKQTVDKSERTLITSTGKEIPILKTVTPITLKGRQCLIEVFVDLTEKKSAEEQLLQAQKMEAIGTLAGGIAHDFNNILSPLIGYAEMLKEDLPVDHPFQENANTMLDSALRARDLVKQILTFSRKTESEAKPLKLQLIIKEAIKLLRPSIPKTIEIDQRIDFDCGPVNADPTKLHQIIMNLSTNAYHAMEENGGKLAIALNQTYIDQESSEFRDFIPGTYACMTVADTGIGIKKDDIEKIFDPYFTTKEIGKGTGLGLSVIHGIVEEYNGGIRVVSEPGKGTEIHVYLPIIDRRAEKRIETEGPVIGGTEKILLVDDEEAVARMEERMLQRLGYQVTTRTGSIEALEAFKANAKKFDLILTDMAMPNMNGLQLAKKIKKIKPDIPIIICTGFSNQLTNEKCQALDIQSCIMKPIILKELAGTIRKVFDALEPNSYKR